MSSTAPWRPAAQAGRDDPATRFAEARAAGATVVHEPARTDYGSRLFEVRDPEGNRWSVGTRRE